ncbi:MAG: hypothetical protein IJ071_04950 [Ruminococcus sp.]|nr:hypothetical protein [Ruminococcus sp.]
MKKAIKTYFSLTFSPIMLTVALVFAAVLLVAAVKEPAEPGSEDYMSMVGAIGFGHIGILLFMLLGALKTTQNKFFLSLPFAKDLVIGAPVILCGALGLIFDTAAALVTHFFWDGIPNDDVIIVNAANTVLMTLIVCLISKNTFNVLKSVLYMGYFLQGIFLPKIPGISGGIFGGAAGHSMAALLIAAVIYAAGLGLAVLLLSRWWNSPLRGPMNVPAAPPTRL